MKNLRILLLALDYTITFPIRILIIIGSIIFAIICAIKYEDPISEWIGYVVIGMKNGMRLNIRWIETGEVTDFEEEEDE